MKIIKLLQQKKYNNNNNQTEEKEILFSNYHFIESMVDKFMNSINYYI